MRIRVLLVEDEPSNAELVRETLADDLRSKFSFTDAWCLSDALHKLSKASFDAILLDLGLPDGDGLEVLHAVHERAGDTPIVVLTGRSSADVSLQVLEAGASDYIGKHEMTAERLYDTLYALAGQNREVTSVDES